MLWCKGVLGFELGLALRTPSSVSLSEGKLYSLLMVIINRILQDYKKTLPVCDWAGKLFRNVVGCNKIYMWRRERDSNPRNYIRKPCICKACGMSFPICMHFCMHSVWLIHTTSWKWLHQSQESLRQKGANNALYWQKIVPQVTHSFTVSNPH